MGKINAINASSLNAGENISITQHNYAPTKLPIDGIDERRGMADWSLLSKLWDLVNPKYIDQLDDQTQNGMIDYDEYVAHIYEYLEVRREIQNKFHHPELELAFTEFDKVLRDYSEAVRPAFTTNIWGNKNWYMSEERETKLIDHRPLTEKEYQIVQSRFDQVIKQSIALLKQSKKLTITIRDISPDFFTD